nr:hypothetical protein [Roseburia sp. AF42-8]
MSAKTKIVVLHMKELIYTGIFAVLGILLVLLLVYMFSPDKDEESRETMKYVAGYIRLPSYLMIKPWMWRLWWMRIKSIPFRW